MSPNPLGQYTRRIIDDELDGVLSTLPAVSLEGPRGVGKTATAEQRATTVFSLDDPAQRNVVAADPGIVLAARAPVLIDEWQRVPAVWDIVRRAVDRGSGAGRFILTGSAGPATPPSHSGAGRIVTLRMRPMTLDERGLATPTVSLAAVLTGQRPTVSGTTDVGMRDYVDAIVASGFPGFRHLRERSHRRQIDGYLRRIIDVDFRDAGRDVRRPALLERWLAAYAAATATTSSFETIRDAATAGHREKPAKTTTMPYRDVLEGLWIVEPLPAWLPTRNRLTRLAQAPKHHLADPALAVGLLGLDAPSLLAGGGPTPATVRDGPLLGRLFESLVTLGVRVFAQAAEARVFHLRQQGGRRETDLIVERRDQRVVAIEVKLGNAVEDEDVRHLAWLRENLGPACLDALVVHTGHQAYRRPDGIAVVPAALLGA
jgi:predicted AAA+ superfamily ATPase